MLNNDFWRNAKERTGKLWRKGLDFIEVANKIAEFVTWGTIFLPKIWKIILLTTATIAGCGG